MCEVVENLLVLVCITNWHKQHFYRTAMSRRGETSHQRARGRVNALFVGIWLTHFKLRSNGYLFLTDRVCWLILSMLSISPYVDFLKIVILIVLLFVNQRCFSWEISPLIIPLNVAFGCALLRWRVHKSFGGFPICWNL